MSEENRTDQRKTREMVRYDEICKHLLSYKPILARILKECVEEYHDLSYEAIQACIEPDLKGAHMHIIGRNTEYLTIPEAKILYDLLFTAALPKQKEQVALFINIEAKNRDDPSYPLLKRALYDGSRLLAGQKGEQHGFEHSSYGEIKKVYTIWLCFGHAKKKADVINRYRIEEKQERGNWKSEKADYDVLEVVMVYPGEKRREEENGMMELLKELFCEGGEEKGKRLEEKYGIRMTKEMEKEVDRMCNLSQIFVDKGMEKGLVLGESKGKEESNVACVRSLSKHLSIRYEEAMDLLEIEEALRPSVMERLHHPRDRETAK